MLNRSGNTTDNLCFRYRFRDVFSRFRCCVYNGTGPLLRNHNGNMELHVSAMFQKYGNMWFRSVIIAFFLFFKSESVYYLSRGEVKNAPWRENLDFLQLCFQQISELFPPRQFWRDLLLLDLSKGFLSELVQRCIERFVIFKRLGFHRKRLIIELCLDCLKQTTCCCSRKGWQQNSNRPHSQWCVGHLSHITPYQSYLSCALCILLEQDNTYYKLTVTNAIAWMCASIALSKKFIWCLSCPSDTYSSSFLLLATVR